MPSFKISIGYIHLWLPIFLVFLASNSSVEKTLEFNSTGATAQSGSDQQIPVLCYHQIRDWENSDSKNDRVYIMPVERFKAEMKMLHDSGYRTIDPGQLIAHLKNGEKLPPRSVLITFDDGTESQFASALPELNKYGFKATFFIMTVTIDRHRFMSKIQIQTLSKQGNTIGCHTWNHEDVTKYKESDWTLQMEKPALTLEKITGLPVKYFAYPYGSWNNAAIENLKKLGFEAAFQLTGKSDAQNKLFTLRRILVDSHWTASQLLKEMKRESK